MAEGLLRHLAGDSYEVFSAGTHPSIVHPLSIAVMEEKGIDISSHTSNHLNEYRDKKIDIVITVCDSADKLCPIFPGAIERIHWSIDDPFRGWNFDPNQLDAFRETREKIKKHIKSFLEMEKKQNLD